MTIYEYQIEYHDNRKNLPMLTIKTRFPLDAESKSHTRIGRPTSDFVTAHVTATNTREALERFWELYDNTNAAHI